jgi:hypothetical protein
VKFLGTSLKLTDPFDERRDEDAVLARTEQVEKQVAALLADGYEVYAVDEVRVEHEAETRRMWLPRRGRTEPHVNRKKSAQSFFGALSLTKMKTYPVSGDQDAELDCIRFGGVGLRPLVLWGGLG